MTLAIHRRSSLVLPATFALGVVGMAAMGGGLGPVTEAARDTSPVVRTGATWAEAIIPSPVTERRRDAITDIGL